ncbi:hypothetical protein Dred_1039 [Desulforamulus reducens MI-1]|uniref:Tfp pilus assembly protein PilO n=1 Tax=Desulforamulus reducens (strain ATCC BAA-1160 / DSM 100696 / MI-1) TaxID=349161 RepID=A4J3C1_DESRM|nr:type 4a pilus biogenesis protein PilO [Desulforamulus reducens]ABO49574.1 hypothetical protein Dred_1039 [Desulforamulus reducens MI-1]
MKQKKSQQYLTALLAVIAGVLMVFLIYHQLMSLKAARQEALSLESALTQTNSQLQSLVKLQKQAVNIQEQIDKLEQVMPAEPLEDLLIKDLQANASIHDLHLLEISFDDYINQKDYGEIPFNFTLEGQYLGLLDFLKDLQRGPRAVLIKEIKITKEEPDLPIITINVTASTFFTNE